MIYRIKNSVCQWHNVIHCMIPKRNVSGSDLYHHCNVSCQWSNIYPDRKDQVEGSIWSTSLWTLSAVDFIHRCFKVRPNYFRILSLFFTLKGNKSLPLSKIMKKQLFCVMNPFDEMCNQKDIDCLTMAFLDNRQFVGKTVRRVSNSKLRIYPDIGLQVNSLSNESIRKPFKVQKPVLWMYWPKVLYPDSIHLHHN